MNIIIIVGIQYQPNRQVLQGLAKLVDAHTVEVAGRRVTADKILIAVGGWPARPRPQSPPRQT